jgi:myo-inositol-1(or 4)-monophosphatase
MKTPLQTAIEAALAAGDLLRENFGGTLDVNAFEAHDIKLELDVRSQDLITQKILAQFPDHAILGEEGVAGSADSPFQWVVDPIDGTVNYFYGVPHFCVSIALKHGDDITAGVILDPMRNELWAAEKGAPTTLNGKPVRVSQRTRLRDAILSVGFSKTKATINAGMPLLEHYVQRARKCRLMGSAALDLAYVACGRLDAYIEQAVSLWDVAAGKLLVEGAGGIFQSVPREDNPQKISVRAWNGVLELEA